MAGYIIVGTLAAFGMLCLGWVLLGWFLPRGRNCVILCAGMPDEGTLARYRWLRETGMLNCPLICVDADGDICCDDIEICAGKDLLTRLEWERKDRYGTGTGDPAGRNQRCDISEL